METLSHSLSIRLILPCRRDREIPPTTPKTLIHEPEILIVTLNRSSVKDHYLAERRCRMPKAVLVVIGQLR